MSLHNPISHLRAYYVQKVLPAVYDDSLSYYEILCKVQETLNEVVSTTNEQSVVVLEMQQAINDFINGGYTDSFEEYLDKWFEENSDAFVQRLIDEGIIPEVEDIQSDLETVHSDIADLVASDASIRSDMVAADTELQTEDASIRSDMVAADLELTGTKVPYPLVDETPSYGTSGQVLATNADGTTDWQDPVIPSDAQAEQIITQWLNAHPEATTTVQDGAISTAKLANGAVTDAKLAQSGGVLEEVANLNGNMVKRYIPTSSATANKFVNTQTGAITDSDTYSFVEFSVVPNDTLLYKTGHNESGAVGIAFYTADDEYISGNQATTSTQRLTVPNNANFARASYRTAEVSAFSVKICEYIEVLVSEVANISAEYGTRLSAVESDGYVTTAKLANGAVTDAKLAQSGGVLEEVANLNGNMVKRYIPTSSATANKFVNTQTGAITDSGSYSFVEFSVVPNDTLLYKTGHNESGTVGIAFYTADDEYISGNQATTSTQTLTVPNNGRIARASYRTAEVSAFSVKICEYIEVLVSEVNTLSNETDTLMDEYNYLNPTETVNSVWGHGNINTYGEETGSSAYARSGYIYIPLGLEKFVITLNQLTYSSSMYCIVHIYNTDKTHDTSVSVLIGETDITQHLEGGQYIRCVIRDGSTVIDLNDISNIITMTCRSFRLDETLTKSGYFADAKAVRDEINALPIGTNYAFAMTKVLCIGDSLTRGSSPTEDWGVSTGTVPIAQNYPYMLGRMINCDVTNSGYSGISASTWYEAWADTTTPVEEKTYPIPHYDFADYDTFIIWLGTNRGFDPDDINTSGTQTNYLCEIIEAIQEGYAAGHTDPNYSDYGLIVLCKVFATKDNLAKTNAGIDAVANKYNIPIIDNSDLGFGNHPELHENKDNPHFGKAGYIFIADRICSNISKWIRESPTRADFGESETLFNN